MSVIVTDHALIRYLERVRGMDMEGYRTKLAASIAPAAARKAKSVAVDGFVYEFSARPSGHYLTTVRPNRSSRKRREAA